MHCRSCNAPVSEQNLFCHQCGMPVPKACPWCGQDNPPKAKFCGQCGSAVALRSGRASSTTHPALAIPDAERRQLTVMFCDLVGSTKLARRLDPEDLREITRDYQEMAARVIRMFDGYVAQLLGDGILVYFGYPRAHEDDPQRAARTALGILESIRELNSRLSRDRGLKLAIRIGIHTGTTVIGAMGDSGHSEQLAIGETPNVAARLQGIADPNSAVVSAVTMRLCRGQFDWDDLGLRELAGVDEPVHTYRLVRTIRARTAEQRLPGDALIPLQGRQRELSRLREAWTSAAAGHGRIAVIGGEAGIGKSRLLRTLASTLTGQAYTWLESTCSRHYVSTALRPLAELLGLLCEIADEDTPPIKLRKLEDTLLKFEFSLSDSVPLLGPLLGADPTQPGATPLSPPVRKQRTAQALVDVLVALAKDKPLVLVLENVHWLDRSSMDVLGLLAEHLEHARILCVFTTRMKFEPSWPVDARIELGRLPSHRIAEITHSAASDKPLADDVVQLIVNKAGGNPMYAEELTRTLIESGQLLENNGFYEFKGAIPTLDIPLSLRDSLMARLDRLTSARLTLQVGATIGQEFDYLVLRDTLDVPDSVLQRELDALIVADLIHQRGTPPHSVYSFKHALLQDAAYDSLLRRTRQTYHRRIAEVIESGFPETPAEVIAHHYSAAGADDKAIEHWSAAGQTALQSWALVESVQHLQRALALVETRPESSQRSLLELGLRVLIGVPLMLTSGYAAPEVEATYRRAFELCRTVDGGDAEQLLPALWGLWIFYQVQARYATAEEMGERLLELAQRSGDAGVELGAQQALGASRFWRGQVDAAQQHFERALEIYDEERHAQLAFLFGQDARVFCLSFLIWVHWHNGDLARARECRRQALEHCARLGQPGSHGFAELLVATFHCLVDEYQLASEHARRLISLSAEQGMPHWEACGRITLGWSMHRERSEEAASGIRAGIDALRAIGSRTAMSFWLGALIRAELACGRVEAAQAVLDDLQVFTTDESDEHCVATELQRLRGEISLARGDSRDVVVRLLASARQAALDQNAAPLVAWAESSLRRVDAADDPGDSDTDRDA